MEGRNLLRNYPQKIRGSDNITGDGTKALKARDSHGSRNVPMH